MEEQKFKKIFKDSYSYEKECFLEDELSRPVEKRTVDQESILHLIKATSPNNLLDIIINKDPYLTDEEFNYIKRYFLKFYPENALKLYSIKQDKFEENEKDYLLACCFDNLKLAYMRLKFLIENDFAGENPIAYKLVDLIMGCNFYFDIVHGLLYIQNDDLQRYILNRLLKDQDVMDFLESKVRRLPVKSLLYKHIFYKNITNKEFVDLLLCGDFLGLDEPEKQVFHDLYKDLIYTKYIKSSKIKLMEYFKSYKQHLFNNEMIPYIKKIYNDNPPFKKSDLEEMFLLTEFVYDFYNSQRVIYQLDK